MFAPEVRDEFLAAEVTEPRPGQLLVAVNIRPPYAAVPRVMLIDVGKLSDRAKGTVYSITRSAQKGGL